MKNILLLVHDDEGQEARFQTALDLTRACRGHLTCVDVTQPPIAMADALIAPGAPVLLRDEYQTEALNKKELQSRLEVEDVAWNWIDVMGPISQSVIGAAKMADVIVLNRRLQHMPGPNMIDIATRVINHSRALVVAAPDSARQFKADGRALVAWDGQDSAIAALRASVPLLKLASGVEIFMARDGAEKIEPEEAAEYLSRHGIPASVRVIDDGLHRADELIMDACDQFGADYVVMGAYSHGSLIEAFGGVTKRLLSGSKLPLVLGH